MRHVVFVHEDGSSTAVPVNGMSVVNVRTWTPPVFGDGATMPQLVEDQSVALAGVVSVSYSDGVPADATVLETQPELELLSEAEAGALDSQFESVPLEPEPEVAPRKRTRAAS